LVAFASAGMIWARNLVVGGIEIQERSDRKMPGRKTPDRKARTCQLPVPILLVDIFWFEIFLSALSAGNRCRLRWESIIQSQGVSFHASSGSKFILFFGKNL